MSAKPQKPSAPASPATPPEAFSRLVEECPDCLKVLDLDGHLLSMNAGGMRVLEICDFAPLKNSFWPDFWRGDDKKEALAAVAAARAGKVGRFTGYFETTQTKTPKWWDVVISPILDASGKPEKLLASSRDVTEWKRDEQLLKAIIAGTSTVTGREFFASLVENLAKGLGVRYSFVAECIPNDRSRALAAWFNGKPGPDFEYPVAEAPCREVMKGRTFHVECEIQQAFPKDTDLVSMEAQSYLGVPMCDATRRIIGHLVIMDDKPMARDPLTLSVMETFASRAAVELERLRAYEHLKRQFHESEERLRDLFDEAPIAYVNEGLDSKFIRVNRAAMRILGIKPEEVAGAYGKSFVPDTPEAQRRLQQAFEAMGHGTDKEGIVLELRRKDNGQPIWIQWWSRPDPSGQYTRTMFIDITERVLMEREKARLEAQNSYLQEEIRTEHHFDEIVGSSPALMEVLRQVEQIARIDSTVLVLGETGTGKELVARAIHDRSPRRNRPLVKVNCGAISAGLVESELFGHVKGAFTGAIASRDGRFKLADGGTIFLDEVGELPMDTQVKLLRVLQEQEFEPIGSSKTIKVNVRVVTATNRDLEELVREGKFRADLFYRLNVVPLRVPALRERAGDLPLLVTFFVQKLAAKLGKHIKSVSEEAMQQLTSYTWPGNVRELQNVIERAVILSPGNTLVLAETLRAPALLPGSSQRQGVQSEIRNPKSEIRNEESLVTPPASEKAGGSLEDVERRHIESILNQTNWMIEGERGAAKMLNLNPSTLRSRMQKLNIKRPARP
jgi:PAS domain S-box-containing protein